MANGHPEAFVIKKLDGTARRIIDAAKYDPRDASFWISAEAQADHVVTPLYPPPVENVVGWQPMSSAPRDGTHILALLYREATNDMDDRRWPAFSEIREIFYKPYLAFGMQLPWHAGDPLEEPSGTGSEHMGEGVPIAWQALPSVDIRAALASASEDAR